MKKSVKIIITVVVILLCAILLFPITETVADGATTYHGSILMIYRVKVFDPIYDDTIPTRVTLELFGKEIYEYEIKNNISNAKVNLGTSEFYSDEELQSAVDVILNEIGSWSSVKKVYDVAYCGDETAADNLDYCNMLNGKEYTQCVVFESSFFTSHSAGSEGFNPDDKYSGWKWYLAKNDGGEWELLTWGY